MSAPANRNITLTIGGRKHVVSIAPDEEAHVRVLGQMIDDRVSALGLAHGQTEARMLLVAGLVLADELHALQNAAPASAPAPSPAPVEPELQARVAALADRVERLAARLEHSDLEHSDRAP